MWWRFVADTGNEGNDLDDEELEADEDCGIGEPPWEEEGGESSSEKSPSDEKLSSKPLVLVARLDGWFLVIFFFILADSRKWENV
jgi:hypothetical protein